MGPHLNKKQLQNDKNPPSLSQQARQVNTFSPTLCLEADAIASYD